MRLNWNEMNGNTDIANQYDSEAESDSSALYMAFEAMNDSQAKLDSLDNKLGVMESLLGQLTYASENSQLTPVLMQVVTSRIDDLATDIVSNQAFSKEIGVPAVESYSSETSREENLTIAVEGIGDAMKQFFAWMRKIASNAYRTVANFIAKFFGGAKKLKEKFESLKKAFEEARKNNHTAKSDAKVKVKSPNVVQIANKIDDKLIADGTDAINDTITRCSDMVSGIKEDLKTVVADIKVVDDKDDEEAAKDALAALSKSEAKAISSVSKLQARGLPGNKAIVVVSDATTGDSEATGIKNTKISFEDIEGAKPWKGDAEIAVMTLADLEKHCQSWMDTLKTIDDVKSLMSDANDAKKNATDELDKIIKKAEDDTNIAQRVWAKAAGKLLIRRITVKSTSTVNKVYMHSYGVGVNFYAIMNSMKSQYKAPSS